MRRGIKFRTDTSRVMNQNLLPNSGKMYLRKKKSSVDRMVPKHRYLAVADVHIMIVDNEVMETEKESRFKVHEPLFKNIVERTEKIFSGTILIFLHYVICKKGSNEAFLDRFWESIEVKP